MKKCSVCGKEKELSGFDKRSDINGHRSYCKECRKEKRRETHQKYYQKNKVKIKAKQKEIVAINRKYVKDLKKNGCCVDCGEDRWQCLDFDHIDPSQKTNDIKYLSHHSFSLEIVKKELSKCELRCANCHRVRSAKQFGWD